MVIPKCRLEKLTDSWCRKVLKSSPSLSPAKGYCEVALFTQRFLPRVLLFPPCNRVLPFLSIFNRTVSSTPFCGSCFFQQSANSLCGLFD
ncbi:hypothetical protein Gasu2_50390 [Galdieria sulphuraria]|nr:hypothetical protein Gasu2_50390 [Galdieria sulphuraria]